MTVQYDNLAGTILYKNDGNLTPEAAAAAPRVCIVGTAGDGQGSLPYLVQTTSLAKGEFGTDGNLIRGMWEAKKAGAEEIYLYRLGATPASAVGIGNDGGTGGYTVQTVEQDEDAGGNYSLYYDDSANRLVVKRNSDDLIVFDNSSTDPIERYEVVVSGYRASVGGADIGSASSFVNLEDIVSAGTVVTEGTDGLDLSRMETYEKLYVAYEQLK